MDVHFSQSKDWMTQHGADGQFVMANATIKDVVCQVTFTPKYNQGTETMSYDVEYKVLEDNPNSESGEYEVEFDQIIYKLNGKVRFKTLEDKKVFPY